MLIWQEKTNFAIENTSKRRIFGAIMEFRFCTKPTGKHEQAPWNGVIPFHGFE